MGIGTIPNYLIDKFHSRSAIFGNYWDGSLAVILTIGGVIVTSGALTLQVFKSA